MASYGALTPWSGIGGLVEIAISRDDLDPRYRELLEARREVRRRI